jgi:4,5-dihydroxyphthalate decarboxylase
MPQAKSDLPLTFACGLYDRMVPLYAGETRPAGIDLDFLAIDSPREIFDRMAGAQAFDASEMSLSEVVTRIAAKQCPFVAIPVFPSRVFRHGFITVNRKSVRSPKDLAGKRIGVPLYTQTAAVFMRGLLAEDYGVDLSGVRWVEGAINAAAPHGRPTVLPVLRPVSITANNTGRSLSDLLAAGEIDAILGTSLPVSIKTSPDVQRLFPDFRAAEQDYYRRTRIFPIMHLVAIRREIYERHPFVAPSLYKALCASKDLALEKMRYLGALRYMLPWLMSDLDEIDEIFGGDPWPYGIEPNRPTLEAALRYLYDQALIAAPLSVEDIFEPLRDGCRF